MEERIIRVFYNQSCFPFKDKERTVHFSIVGNAFIGASNTTEIRFYIDRIGGNLATWVANGKLANGEMGHQVLSSSYDSELEEHYVTFSLSAFYTQIKGDLTISLAGYNGGLTYEEVSAGVYEISGTPVIQTTGVIKINIAYATGLIQGEEDEYTFNDFFELLSEKLDIKNGIVVAPSVAYILTNIANYENGQVFFPRNEQKLYYLDNGLLKLYSNNLGIIQTSGLYDGATLDKDIVNLPVCYIYHTNTGMIYRKISVDNGLVHFANEFSFMDGSDSQYDTLGRVTFDVNSSTGVISNSTIYTKQIYNKDQVDTQFYNKDQADTKFASKSGNNTFGGTNTFENAPKSNAQPSNNDDLTRKDYVDNETSAIDNKISILASPSNKVLSESEIDSKISTAEATYRGLFNSVAELNAYSGAKDKNDYAWVTSTDSVGNTIYTRYIYNGSAWLEQWTISNISFTTAQWNAINSGATSVLIEYLEGVYNGTIKVAKAIDSDKLGGNNASEYVRSVNHLTPVDGNIDTLATITAFSIEVDDENDEDLALYVTHAGEFEANALSIVDEGDNAYLCITVN